MHPAAGRPGSGCTHLEGRFELGSHGVCCARHASAQGVNPCVKQRNARIQKAGTQKAGKAKKMAGKGERQSTMMCFFKKEKAEALPAVPDAQKVMGAACSGARLCA